MKSTVLMLTTAIAAAPALAADPATIDWSKVPEKTIALFYPGQSSYKWVSTVHSAPGRAAVQKGQACTRCHEGSEKEMGDSLVKGGPLEPAPVKGKPGSVDVKLQVAYDAKNAYFRAQWKTANPYPGIEHQYLRFDGKEWKVYGYPKLDKVVQDGQQPGIYEDRFSIMLDDGKVPNFAQQGCWLTCHEGERDMPGFADKAAVQANPLMAALKKNDIRKYLPATRSDAHDWKSGKAVDEIAKLKADGHFLELIQWRAHRSNAVGMADDGYVLAWREFDEGKNMFGGNADAATHAPKFMWDEKKVGYKSITAEQLRKGEHFLIKDVNAVPFDPNAGWKTGDLIPDYYVSPSEAKGSAADNKAIANWKDGVWTVVLVRPLGLTNADDKTLKDGGVYNVGFAVHDDNITTRGHFVSFVRTLGFGAKADIQATKLP
jgi:hypothetical protein